MYHGRIIGDSKIRTKLVLGDLKTKGCCGFKTVLATMYTTHAFFLFNVGFDHLYTATSQQYLLTVNVVQKLKCIVIIHEV